MKVLEKTWTEILKILTIMFEVLEHVMNIFQRTRNKIVVIPDHYIPKSDQAFQTHFGNFGTLKLTDLYNLEITHLKLRNFEIKKPGNCKTITQ